MAVAVKGGGGLGVEQAGGTQRHFSYVLAFHPLLLTRPLWLPSLLLLSKADEAAAAAGSKSGG